ncbi:hypothetical protein [Mesorhizobium sp. WSM3868]|uniref:hypothetical protein n=1 Tax=Mesorhizobium sp. WSM3868 TaxID=2029405 RepID=UPI0032AFACA8
MAASLNERVRRVIPPFEWSAFADDIEAILALKRARNAVILAHNYQSPKSFTVWLTKRAVVRTSALIPWRDAEACLARLTLRGAVRVALAIGWQARTRST